LTLRCYNIVVRIKFYSHQYEPLIWTIREFRNNLKKHPNVNVMEILAEIEKTDVTSSKKNLGNDSNRVSR